MKIKKLKLLFAMLLFIGAIASTNAQLLTFDDLPSTISAPIGPGYGSVVWINFDYLDNTIDPIVAASGYHNGAVSGHQVAFNGSGTPASVTSGSLFTFTSLWLAGAWNDGLNVKIEGFLGPNLLYSNTYVVDTHAASFIPLNYFGVSQVTFTSFGGTQSHSVAGTGTQFVMDNAQLNGPTAVPEPSTYGLAAAALVAGIAATRRRRASAARA